MALAAGFLAIPSSAAEAAFKAAPEPNITEWLIKRAHRRYNLAGGPVNQHVASAWANFGASRVS